MEYSYKFRLYPNRKQETQMLRTFGCCRFVFNHYLADRIETYKETGSEKEKTVPEPTASTKISSKRPQKKLNTGIQLLSATP